LVGDIRQQLAVGGELGLSLIELGIYEGTRLTLGQRHLQRYHENAHRVLAALASIKNQGGPVGRNLGVMDPVRAVEHYFTISSATG
jgi:hypothetical protein